MANMTGDPLSESEMLHALLQKNVQRVTDLEKNVDSFFVVVISIIIFFIGCFVYWAIGYAFAFGEGNLFIGYSGWFGTFTEDLRINWLFHFVFAATACTIVSGSVAERCDIWPYFIYSSLITGIVYPVVSRWAWYGDGWLADGFSVIEGVSYQDFAGSGVVHLTGGVAALWGAAFCGPRLGRFQFGSPVNLPGHSIPLAALGAFILLFGFFAFNGGSQYSVSQAGDGVAIATAILNTIISGTGGAMSNLILTKAVGMIQEKKYGSAEVRSSWSLLTTINGALVGMVSICAGCNTLKPWAAFLTGVLSSVFYFAISIGLVSRQIDDPLEAVAVHGGGGIWGVLSAPLLSDPSNPSIEMGKQFAVNLVGMLAIIVWTSAWSALIFGTLHGLKMLRVPPNMELKGMDAEKHGEPAYPVAAWQEAWGDFMSGLSEEGGKQQQDRKSTSKLVGSLITMSSDSQSNSTAIEEQGSSSMAVSLAADGGQDQPSAASYNDASADFNI